MIQAYADFVKTKFELLRGLINKHEVRIYTEEVATANVKKFSSVLPLISKDVNKAELSLLSFADDINRLVTEHGEL